MNVTICTHVHVQYRCLNCSDSDDLKFTQLMSETIYLFVRSYIKYICLYF